MLYTPSAFSVSHKQLYKFMEDFSFATVVTKVEGEWYTTLVPLLLEKSADSIRLYGHMAKANPHWKVLVEYDSLAMFQGPHAYISPSWYANTKEVPTWNYATAKAEVTAELIQDRDLLHELVVKTVDKFEGHIGNPWDRAIDETYWEKQLKGIIGFRFHIKSVTGKFKLGQNKPEADMRSLVDHLRRQESTRELLEFMKALESD